MNCYEKYYRRSYNALNKLIEAYKDGFVVSNTIDFQAKRKAEYMMNPKIALEEQGNFIFTTMVALLGLNKESIENTNKFADYSKNSFLANLRTQGIAPELMKRIALFDTQRVRSTDFDSWLSILIDVPSDTKNIDHLKRIRNGLLHSNFYVDDSFPELNIGHIKTKNYYEAEILGPEFNMFIVEYFSNLERLGLSEKMYNFNILVGQINNANDLIYVLKSLKVVNYNYEKLKTLCKDTPELLMSDCVNKDGFVNAQEFFKKLSNTKNFENFTVDTRSLTDIEVSHMFVYIAKNYGDEFWKIDNVTQLGIISSYLQTLLNPKRSISNWLMHFSYLYCTLFNGKFASKFFAGDDFDNISCYSALMILKAYLVMYRMQQNDFADLDYSKVYNLAYDFDVTLDSENLNDSADATNYFKVSFDKEKAKGILTSDVEIWNKVVCEVIRDSLAHGNVNPIINLKTFEQEIELMDIDKKHGTVRKLSMPLKTFEEFLNSEAFNPKNCYTRTEDALGLTRKKSE